MSTIVTVVGATGVQGGSIIRALLSHENHNKYTIRAITRNKDSEGAKKLSAQDVEVVEADANNLESLEAAFAGSHVIFAVTNFFEPFASLGEEEAARIETTQGINMAKAAAATSTLKHYVWSTLANNEKFGDGKYIIPYYGSKNKVDDYIKSNAELLKRTTFMLVGFYGINITYPFFKPFSLPSFGEPRLMQMLPCSPSVKVPMAGDEDVNIGLFFKAIIEKPDISLPGKAASLHTQFMPIGDYMKLWADEQKADFECIQVDKETYCRLWPGFGLLMYNTLMYYDTLKEKGLSGGFPLLTKDDLGVEGLVDTKAALARVNKQQQI